MVGVRGDSTRNSIEQSRSSKTWTRQGFSSRFSQYQVQLYCTTPSSTEWRVESSAASMFLMTRTQVATCARCTTMNVLSGVLVHYYEYQYYGPYCYNSKIVLLWVQYTVSKNGSTWYWYYSNVLILRVVFDTRCYSTRVLFLPWGVQYHSTSDGDYCTVVFWRVTVLPQLEQLETMTTSNCTTSVLH